MSNSKKSIYILFISELNLSKIGISENVGRRVKQLQTGCPFKIDVVRKYDTANFYKIEKVLHRKYRTNKMDDNEYNLVGEWFNIPIGEVLNFEENCKEIEDTIIFLRNHNNPFIN